METTVLVIAKEPIPGRVKTRLCPPCTHDEAAYLAAGALATTLETVARLRGVRRVLVFDGSPSAFAVDTFECVAQRGGGLDERLEAAFIDAAPTGPVLLIGMDTPQVSTASMRAAFDALDDNDAVIGLAPDGGWWLIGFRHAPHGAFRGVTMSAATTGQEQIQRLRAIGLHPVPVASLRDVDTFQDALEVGGLIPTSEFGRRVRVVQHQVGRRERVLTP